MQQTVAGPPRIRAQPQRSRRADVALDELLRGGETAGAENRRPLPQLGRAELDRAGRSRERLDECRRIEPLADRRRVSRLLPGDRRAKRSQPVERAVETFPDESLQHLVAVWAFG